MPDTPRTADPAPSDEDAPRREADELSSLFAGGSSGDGADPSGGSQEASSQAEAAGDAEQRAEGEDNQQGRAGRPRKAKAERKSERVAIYFTPAQLAEVETKAEAAGRSLSGFIGRAALGKDVTPKADAETRHQLQRAGARLNRLAKVAAATGEIEAGRQLESALSAVREAAEQIT